MNYRLQASTEIESASEKQLMYISHWFIYSIHMADWCLQVLPVFVARPTISSRSDVFSEIVDKVFVSLVVYLCSAVERFIPQLSLLQHLVRCLANSVSVLRYTSACSLLPLACTWNWGEFFIDNHINGILRRASSRFLRWFSCTYNKKIEVLPWYYTKLK